MPKNVVAVHTTESFHLIAGEPILDTDEGVLILAFDDGSSRTFNWRYVIDYYQLTEEEVKNLSNAEEGYL